MEVSNNSKTDPAAWVARVVGVTKKAVAVEYPFHDTPGEPHKVRVHGCRRCVSLGFTYRSSLYHLSVRPQPKACFLCIAPGRSEV